MRVRARRGVGLVEERQPSVGAPRAWRLGRLDVADEVRGHGLPQQHADLGRVGEQPDRLGAADLLGVAVPRGTHEVGQVLDQRVEPGDVRGRGAGDQGPVALRVGAAVAARRDVAALVVLAATLLVTLRVGSDHRGLDHVGAPPPRQLPDDVRRRGVHLVGLLPGQPRGHPHHAPGLPLLDLARHHPPPQARVPVPQVERLAERLGAREGRGPGVDGVLSDTRGRDRRSAVAARSAADPQTSLPRGGRARLLAAAHGSRAHPTALAASRGRSLLTGRDVLVGPGHRQQKAPRAQQSTLPFQVGDRVRGRRTRRAPPPTSREPAGLRRREANRPRQPTPPAGQVRESWSAASRRARRRPPGPPASHDLLTRTCLRL